MKREERLTEPETHVQGVISRVPSAVAPSSVAGRDSSGVHRPSGVGFQIVSAAVVSVTGNRRAEARVQQQHRHGLRSQPHSSNGVLWGAGGCPTPLARVLGTDGLECQG